MIRLKALALVALASLMPLAAPAQTVTLGVRGGEHADFTRLVIHLPEESTWRLTREGRRARLDLTGPPVDFDLAQTFARIPRTRLHDAVAKGSALQLELACACEVRASEDIPQYLVIDIIGARATRSAAPGPRPRPRPWPTRPSGTSGQEAARAGQHLAQALRTETPPDTAPRSLTLDRFAAVAPLPRPDAPDDPPRAEITAAISRALAGSVARGLLEADDTATLPEPPAPPATAPPHLAIARDATPRAADRPDCALAALLALPDAAGAQLNHPPVASLAQLYGEFDRPDPAAIAALAQHYIHLGFGAETRLVLQLDDPESSTHHLLTQIAHLVDLDPAPDPDALLGHARCTPMAALWAFLARPAPDPDADLLLQAVDALPPHLRMHLGSALIKRLTRVEAFEAAQRIRAAIDRVASTPDPALQLARATLELGTAPPGRASIDETDLDPARSDETLLFLLAQRDAQEDPLAPALRALALDRLLVLRGTPKGQTITAHLLRAKAREGDFTEAAELLARHAAHLAPDQYQQARADLMRALTDTAEDADFVTQVFALAPWSGPLPDAALRDRLAGRLAELGFAEQAAQTRAASLQNHTDDTPQALQTSPGPDAADGSSFAQRAPPDLLARARAAQRQLAENAAPAPDNAAELARSLDAPTPAPEPTRAAADQGGLLTESRAALNSSAALRTRLNELVLRP